MALPIREGTALSQTGMKMMQCIEVAEMEVHKELCQLSFLNTFDLGPIKALLKGLTSSLKQCCFSPVKIQGWASSLPHRQEE